MLFRNLKPPGAGNSIFLVENCLHSKVFYLRLNLKIEGGAKKDDSKQVKMLEKGEVQCLFPWEKEGKKGYRAS